LLRGSASPVRVTPMRLGVVLTSHDTVAGASLSSRVGEQLEAFSSIGLKLISKEEQIVENQYGQVTLVIVVLEQPPCYPVIDRGLQHTIVFLQRHGPGDEPPPHAVNHHANVRALADLKVDSIIATTCVGTLVASFPPGRVGLARQYIDFTGMPVTFHDKKAVFTSVTQPFDEILNKQLEETLRRVQELSDKVRLQYTYWLSCGPQYETEAEVTAIDRFGGEVCGFTMPREAKLCAELGIPYSALLIATNWAAGRHPGDNAKALSHEEVAKCASQRNGVAFSCLVDIFDNAINRGVGQFNDAKRRRLD